MPISGAHAMQKAHVAYQQHSTFTGVILAISYTKKQYMGRKPEEETRLTIKCTELGGIGTYF